MVSLEELERERDKLRSESEVREDMRSHEKKKGKLKREIWGMKHPKTTKVVRVVKQSTEGVGMIFGAMGRKAKPHIKQGLMNFASNAQAQMEGYEQQVRRVVKKKVAKKKSSKKKKVVRVKRVQRKQDQGYPSGIPRFENYF